MRPLLCCLLLAGSLLSQQKDKPLDDKQKLEMYNIVSNVQVFQSKVNTIQGSLEQTELGKKLTELRKQYDEIVDKIRKTELGKQQAQSIKDVQDAQQTVKRRVKQLQESNGAAGKCLGPSLTWVDPGPNASYCP